MAISFIGSTNAALALGVGVFAGRACEWFGYQPMLAFGSVVFCASLLAASFCNSIPTLIVTQGTPSQLACATLIARPGVVNGLAGAILFICSTAAPCVYFKKRINLVIGLCATGAGVGGIAWSFIVRALSDRWSTNWALRVTCFIDIIILFIATLLMRIPLSKTKSNKSGATFMQTLQVFKTLRFSLLYAASTLTVFGYLTPFFYLPLYAQLKCGATQSNGAVISAVGNVGMIAGRILLGQLGDTRFGRVNVVVVAMVLAGLVQLVIWPFIGSSLGGVYAVSLCVS
jgi:predicted MFS family arabinose efflux permease